MTESSIGLNCSALELQRGRAADCGGVTVAARGWGTAVCGGAPAACGRLRLFAAAAHVGAAAVCGVVAAADHDEAETAARGGPAASNVRAAAAAARYGATAGLQRHLLRQGCVRQGWDYSWLCDYCCSWQRGGMRG